MKRKSIQRWIILALVVYALLVLPYYLLQRKIIYQPVANQHIQPSYWGLKQVQLISLKTSDGLKLHAWYLPPTQPDKPTLLYFHGNAGYIGSLANMVKTYQPLGYGMLLPTYRGYAGNPGKPTEQGLYRDARAAVHYLKAQHIPLSRVVLYGRSLGTGVAVQMATEFKVGALILQSPYTSLTAIGQQRYPFLPVALLLHDRYNSLAKIDRIHTPLLIMHGIDDRIIPVSMAISLYRQANQPKVIKLYPHAGHNNLPNLAPTVVPFIRKYFPILK